MSYQHGQTCYPSATSANLAAAAEVVGSFRQVGSSVYVVDLGSATDNSITYIFRDLNNPELSTSATVSVNPPLCQLPGVSEALELGWPVAAVWLAVYSITFLTRQFSDSIQEMRFTDDP